MNWLVSTPPPPLERIMHKQPLVEVDGDENLEGWMLDGADQGPVEPWAKYFVDGVRCGTVTWWMSPEVYGPGRNCNEGRMRMRGEKLAHKE